MNDFRQDRNEPHLEDTSFSPQAFTLAAVLFEAFLAGIAAAGGYLLDFPVSKTFEPHWADFGIGLAAALPFILLFLLICRIPIGPFRRLLQSIDQVVIPRFRGCHFTDLLAISITAGIGEEMLFRGLIQGYLTESIGGSFGIVVGLVVASLLFALMHPMTATYAMVAGVISLYLGWIWLLTGNLLVPITAHAFYDFVVLIYLVRFRKPAGG
ncbi:MAG: CPBP family intramembrane metalloprotease [Planctomycetia bacterium]|jgi:hypothetical protein